MRTFVALSLIALWPWVSLQGQTSGSTPQALRDADAPVRAYEATLRAVDMSQLPSNGDLRRTLEAYRGNLLELIKLYSSAERAAAAEPNAANLVALSFALEDLRYQTQSFHCVLFGASVDYPASQHTAKWLETTERFMSLSETTTQEVVRGLARKALLSPPAN